MVKYHPISLPLATACIFNGQIHIQLHFIHDKLHIRFYVVVLVT